MYNVKGPSKMVAKTTRRGISQNMDNSREFTRNKSTESDENHPGSVPRPVFNSKRPTQHHHQHRQEEISEPHAQMINFIRESWNTVCSENCHNSELYYEDEPNSFLDGFKPFDLESWWGKRLYAILTGSGSNISSSKN